jgi:hypothetical protein
LISIARATSVGGRLSHAKRAHWLLGQLWNCTDIPPNIMHEEIESRTELGERHMFTWACWRGCRRANSRKSRGRVCDEAAKAGR